MNPETGTTGSSSEKSTVSDDASAPPSNMSQNTPLSSRDPDQVSKAELMDVLQKMTKRVKALTSVKASLSERVAAVESDRDRLITFFKSEVLPSDYLGDTQVNTEVEKVDEIEKIQLAWKRCRAINDTQSAAPDGGSCTDRRQENIENIQDDRHRLEKAELHRKIEELQGKDKMLQISLEQLTNQLQNLINDNAKVMKRNNELVEELKASEEQRKSLTDIVRKMEDTSKDANASHVEALEQIHTLHLSEISHLKSNHALALQQLEDQINDLKGSQTSDMEVMKHELASVHATQLETALRDLQERMETDHAKVIAEMKQAHEQQILQASEGASKDANASHVEALEQIHTLHLSEISHLKSNHALALQQLEDQINDLKGSQTSDMEVMKHELASVHATQLETALRDLQERMESDHAKVIAEMKQAHEQQILQASEGASKDADASHVEALEQIHTRHLGEISHLKSNHALALQQLEDQINDLKGSQTSDMEVMKHELASVHATQLETALRDLQERMESDHAKVIAEMKQAHEQQILQASEGASKDANASHIEALEQIHTLHLSEISHLKSNHALALQQLEDQINDLKGSQTSDMEVMKHELASVHATQLETALRDLQERMETDHAKVIAEMKQAHEQQILQASEGASKDANASHIEALEQSHTRHLGEISHLKSNHALALQQLEDQINDLKGSQTSDMEVMKHELASVHATQLETALRDLQERMESDHAKVIAEIKQAHEQQILQASEGASKDANASHVEALEQIHTLHLSEISHLKSNHTLALQQLEDQINDLKGSQTSDMEVMKHELASVHATQLETALRDLQERMESDHAKVIAEMKQAHEQQILQASEGASKDANASHVEALEQIHTLHLSEISHLKSNHTLALQQLEDQINDLKGSQTSDMEVMKHELASVHATQLETALRDLQERMETDHTKVIAEMKQAHEQQILQASEGASKDADASHVEALEQIHTRHLGEISHLKSNHALVLQQLEDQINDLKGSQTSDMEVMKHELASVHATQLETALRDLQERMETDHTKVIAEMKQAHEQQVLQASVASTIEYFTLAQVDEMKDRIAHLENELSTAIDSKQVAVETLTNEKYLLDQELAKVKIEASTFMQQLMDSLSEEKASKQVLVDEIGRLRHQNEERILQLEAEKDDVEGKLQSTQEKLTKAVEVGKKLKEAAQVRLNALEDEKSYIAKEYESKIVQLSTEIKMQADKYDQLLSNMRLEATEASQQIRLLQDNICKLQLELSAREKDMSLLQQTISQKEHQFSTLELSSDSDKQLIDSLQRSLDVEVQKKTDLNQQLLDVKKELEESVKASSATASSLLEHQDQLVKEKDELNSELSDLRKTLNSMKNGYDELQIKVRTLSSSVDTLTSEKQEYESRQEQLNKQLSKLTVTESELTIVRDELNRWKLEHAKTSGLLNRFQSEKDASERKHGQSTALVGMLEAQLAETSDKLSLSQAQLEETLYAVSQKDDEIRTLKGNLERLEDNLMQLQSSRQAASDTANQNFDRELMKKSKLIEVLQKEVQSLQQQITKRSSAAQKLIQEKETECMELKKKNKTLQDEIDNGSLSDRRIFELAAQQSSRDMRATNEIEVREQMLQRITDQLADRDTKLANAELSIRQREAEVERLCRKQRRDDVNTDYLKSVFVQYLSKPTGSSERSSILPILATLLQFDENDYKIIEEGKNKVSWFGQVLPTFIPSSEGSQIK